MWIKAALNGNRSRQEHPAIPLSPHELALEARAVIDAGADALHVHPRDREGRESLAASDVEAALDAVRAACPGVPVGVSTGAWIEPDLDWRLVRLASWQTLPDFASVNFHEPGAEDVARCLLRRGIGVEAGLSSPSAARRYTSFDRALEALRVLIEPPEEEPESAAATRRAVEAVLDEKGFELPRLLHGVGGAAWPLLEAALRRDYDTRIGLEDTLELRDGTRARSNTELVRAADRLRRDIREVSR